MVVQRLCSKRVGYGVRFLCLLTQRPLAVIPVAELAQQMARAWPGSATYLSKAVQALVQSGILVSLRGSAGGYGFAWPPSELSLAEKATHLWRLQRVEFTNRCDATGRLRRRCDNRVC